MKLGFTQQEAAIEQAAAAQSVATKQAETAAKVSANAAEAGSGAAASLPISPVAPACWVQPQSPTTPPPRTRAHRTCRVMATRSVQEPIPTGA